MKLSILLCLCLLAQGVFPHGEGGRATCNAGQCQGRPGEAGPIGPRGIQGLKGHKGEQSAEIGPVGPRGIRGLKGRRGKTGTSEEVEEKVRILEESLKRVDTMMTMMMTYPPMKDTMMTMMMTYPPMKETVCYMGMKSGQIPDSAITSSSDYNANWAAHLGRLDNQPSGSNGGAWDSRNNRVGEWIQVDLGQPEVVAGVVTQGLSGYNDWVTSYKVSCGNVASSMTTITEHGQDKIFSANTDGDTKVVNKFPQLMTCRYVRIYPQAYHYDMTMRLEIIRGICKDIY